jgi:hypothetical protein
MHPAGPRPSGVLGRPDHGKESTMDLLDHAIVRSADPVDDEHIVGHQRFARDY